jgi:hypothetical protein
VTLDALVQALERLVAFQRSHSRPRSCDGQDTESADASTTVAIYVDL